MKPDLLLKDTDALRQRRALLSLWGRGAMAMAGIAGMTGTGLLGLSPTLSHALSWPARQTWTYAVEGRASGIPYRTESSLALSLDGGRFQIVNDIRVPFMGSQIQTSSGVWTEGKGPDPRSFNDNKRKERNAQFDPDQGRIVFPASSLSVTWVAGVQDRISLLLALTHKCQTQSASLKAGQVWRVPVISSSGIDTWQLECKGQHALDLPLGRMNAWQWDRVELPAGEAALSFWLSPQAGGGPVRLLMVQGNGDRVDQRLSKWA